MKPAAALDGGALDAIDAKDEAVRRCAAPHRALLASVVERRYVSHLCCDPYCAV
jgi:hypothetical protein